VSTPAFADEPAGADAQPGAQPSTQQPQAIEQQAPAAGVAAAAPVPKPKFGDISTSGYFRGGFGASSKKGRMTCFGLYSINGSLKSKYRLGNECEQWGELQISTVVYAGDDGTVGTFHFMPVAFIPTTYIGYSPAMVTSAQDQQGQSSTGATVAFPNLYADLTGISWLYGGTAWAGSRYYKRESVYISDFFYWNPSGVGAGIEDAFQIGKIWASAPAALRDVSFSYGAFAVDGQPSGDPYLPQKYALGIRNDLQVRGFRPWRGAELQVGFQYIADWSGNVDDNGNPAVTHGGWGATGRYLQRWGRGENTLVFQYGRGGGTGFGTLARFYYPDFSLNQDTSESRLRGIELLTIQPTDWLGGQGVFVFQHDSNQTPSAGDWISAGGRLSLAFARHAKLLGEVGHDSVLPTNGSGRRSLTKVTGALAITADREFSSRPELRLFYTWALWNVNAQTAHVDSGDLYLTGNALSGAVFGVQAETWW
jgi:maltoporin